MPDLDRIARRPNEYLAETGVPQLTSGLVFALLGSSVLLQSRIHQNFALQMTVSWGSIALCGTVFWFARRVKQRAVFPRGGYVAVERPRSSRILLGIFFALSFVIFVLGILRIHLPDLNSRLLWPGFAIMFALICVISGWKAKSSPTILYGIYFLLLASFLWWLPVNNYMRSGVMELAAGAPFGIFGAMRLRRYLKTTPAAESLMETHERIDDGSHR